MAGKYGGLIGVAPYGSRITPRLEITLSIELVVMKREAKLILRFQFSTSLPRLGSPLHFNQLEECSLVASVWGHEGDLYHGVFHEQ